MDSSLRPAPMGSENEVQCIESDDQDLLRNPVNYQHEQQKQQHDIQEEDSVDKCSKQEGKSLALPFEEWKKSFENLLDDEIGYKKFYEFLETEQLGVLFECWHRCLSYKKYPPNKATAKEVYSRFVRIKDSRVPISDQARNNLALRLRANKITDFMLSEIEAETFSNLRDICYPKFLKSDFFSFFCETFGQVQYQPSNFHAFSKPDFKQGKLEILHEDEGKEINENDIQPSCLTPNEKEGISTKKTLPDLSCLSPDAYRESEKSLMGDPRISCGDRDHAQRSVPKYCNDPLPNVPNFKPLTQRMNNARSQLNPNQFAAELASKLALVQQKQNEERELSVSSPTHPSSNPHSTAHYPTYHESQPMSGAPKEIDPVFADVDNQSWIMPPATDRYSVAGASSHSGSGVHQEYGGHKYNRNVKEKAKGLWDAVHHSLRNGLGECNCQACYERKQHARLYNDYPSAPPMHQNMQMNYCHDPQFSPQHYHQRHQQYDPSFHHQQGYHNYGSHGGSSETMKYGKPYDERYIQSHSSHIREDSAPENPPQDISKIFAWMERNEQWKNYSNPNPMPSPAPSRKKHNLENMRPEQAGQPIAQDLGMPLLPEPDTGNLLEEVKRKLVEEPNQRRKGSSISRQNPARPFPHESQQPPPQQSQMHPSQYYGPNDPHYRGTISYDGSVASGWKSTDNQSAISFNPSQISTVPSSASRLWNENGYYDPTKIGDYHKSDIRSQSSAGRQSRMDSYHSRDYKNESFNDYYSETKSHSSTGRSARYENRHDMDYKSEVKSHSSAPIPGHSGTRSRSEHKSKRSEHHSDVRSTSSAGRSGSSKGRSSTNKNQTVCTYFFGVEPIPYRITIPSTEVTLGQFKAETKKGNYRFFFKTISPDDGETVYEEIKNDNEILPKYKDKVIGKVEKME